MSETKTTKIRLSKYAAEINLSSENLIEFLKGKGHIVKSLNSILSDEMVAEINAHFKKDIEKAEQHHKKVAEFNKKRADKAEKSTKIEEEEIIAAVEEVVEIVTAVEEFEEAAPVPIEEIIEELVEEIVPEVIPETKLEIPIEKQPIVTEVEKIKPAKVPAKFVSPKDSEVNKKRGLKVIGRMDIEEKKVPIQPAKKNIPVVVDQKLGISNSVEEIKKKKRPKTKKKASDAPVTEETPVAKKKKRVRRFEVDEKDVKAAIKKTMLSMDDTSTANRAASRKKKRREREEEEERLQELKTLDQNIIRVNEFIAVSELANLMEVPVGDVISKCISLGLMVSINQRLDVETITLVADEFDFQVEFQKEYTAEVLEDIDDDEEDLQSRPAVVTIMGHVDHGKTSLLDYIRRTNVVAGESGGITQHIGAYRVDVGDNKQITFLDTPGHEAFTAMRARGAQLTDIVVLVVAADDAVMPQTVEALNHAQAAGVPIIIAINKIDKPGANPDKIKQQMADRNVLVEDWGGKYQVVQLSAKTGLNVDVLLEKIILEADLLDLKANPNRLTRGAVVETELDKGRGIMGTILVQKGTLKIGDPFIAGIFHGKVRAMFDERGNKVKEAPPSTPVLVLGFEGAPQAGDTFIVLDSEREAREISLKRQQLKREQDQKQVHHITLDEIAKQISIGGVKELALIVKGDVDGSVEALSDSLMKLSNEEVIVRVIHKGVGGISESDVLLAAASNAIIIGFHVRPNINARKLAESSKVDIRLYSVIYNAISEVKSALEGLLSPIISEEVTGTLEIRDTFKVPKSGTVAGCYVLDGKIVRNNKIRLVRDGIVIHEGGIGNLRRFKDDVKEVDAGYECGLNIENFNDIKAGDIIEAYKIVETKKKLI
jgi:translation initiation factor IF-2